MTEQTMAEALREDRWLISRHRHMLEAGKLRLPDQGNHFEHGGHPVVLMSVPEPIVGTEVAWVDVEIAELVWLLNIRYGLTTIESCQGYEDYDDDPYYVGWSYLAFKRRRDCTKFLALAGDSLRGERRYGWGRDVRFGHSQLARITRAVDSATP
jgi:hypothetical protein